MSQDTNSGWRNNREFSGGIDGRNLLLIDSQGRILSANGVTHSLPMGEQTQTPLALSRFYGGIVVPSMTTLGAKELDRYCFADPLMAFYYRGNGSPNLGGPTSLVRKTGA